MRDLVHAAALKISDLGNPLKTFALVNELRGIDGKQARIRACQTPISEDRAELQNRARTLAVLRGTSLIAMVEATYLRFAPTGPISGGWIGAWLTASLCPGIGTFFIGWNPEIYEGG